MTGKPTAILLYESIYEDKEAFQTSSVRQCSQGICETGGDDYKNSPDKKLFFLHLLRKKIKARI